MATTEGRCPGPILFAVSFRTDDGFGIEMVRPLDEAHAVDIVQALQPGAISLAVPATSLEGKNKYRPLGLDERPGAARGQRGRASDPNPLAHGPADVCSEHEHLGG